MLERTRFARCFAGLMLYVPAMAVAQRPAIPKNIDSPKRTPYQAFSQVENCTQICTFTFTPVPAGYRLVVTYASSFFQNGVPGSQAYATAGYQQDQEQFQPLIYLPLPAAIASPNYLQLAQLSAPVSYYVESGFTPNLRLYGSFASFYGQATLTGYLVSLDQGSPMPE